MFVSINFLREGINSSRSALDFHAEVSGSNSVELSLDFDL